MDFSDDSTIWQDLSIYNNTTDIINIGQTYPESTGQPLDAGSVGLSTIAFSVYRADKKSKPKTINKKKLLI